MRLNGSMDNNSEAHLRQWKHNREFLKSIPASYPDWTVTVAFYTSLHVIDALLAYDKISGIVNHATRIDVLMRTNRYEKIFKAYQPLFGLSQTVRYLAEPGKWVPASEIEDNVFGRYLYRIEASVLKLLGTEQHPEPIAIAAKGEELARKPTSVP